MDLPPYKYDSCVNMMALDLFDNLGVRLARNKTIQNNIDMLLSSETNFLACSKMRSSAC